MKKMLLIQILFLLFFSCKKPDSFPPEFDSIKGTWNAYALWECYGNYPWINCTQLPIESTENDFIVKINENRIKVYNSGVLSSNFQISELNISNQSDSLINFHLILRKLNSLNKISQYIVYHIFNDEIVLSSQSYESPQVSYSYALKRNK